MTLETNLAERPSEARLGHVSSLNLAGASAPALFGKKLVHRGGGNVLVLDAPAYREPATQPKPYNAPLQRLKPRQRPDMLPEVKAHTNYEPGFIWQLGADQCREVLDETQIMCGCKVTRGRYCASHAAINFRGKW